ncbi:MAG TPA: DNA gyrase inhibitor YacG [Allosphingosinicella sp.]|nr:DNA gyrase inhibitor YacG [Allosphingosinicella sp.]
MSTDSPSGERPACPLCGKPGLAAHAPFCSQGCKDRDLLNWLGDAYRVPGPPAGEPGEQIAASSEE